MGNRVSLSVYDSLSYTSLADLAREIDASVDLNVDLNVGLDANVLEVAEALEIVQVDKARAIERVD